MMVSPPEAEVEESSPHTYAHEGLELLFWFELVE